LIRFRIQLENQTKQIKREQVETQEKETGNEKIGQMDSREEVEDNSKDN